MHNSGQCRPSYLDNVLNMALRRLLIGPVRLSHIVPGPAAALAGIAVAVAVEEVLVDILVEEVLVAVEDEPIADICCDNHPSTCLQDIEEVAEEEPWELADLAAGLIFLLCLVLASLY